MTVTFSGISTPENKHYLFSVDIFQQDWLYLGKEIEYYDKRFKQIFPLSLYQVDINGSYYVFGCYTLDEATQETIFYKIGDYNG